MSASPIEPRPAAAFLRQHPELGRIKIQGTSLRELADAQPSFAVARRSERSGPTLLPQTRTAAALLQGDAGRSFAKLITGAVGSLDARDGASQVTGISLSTSPEGFTTNRLLREHEESFDVLSLPVDQRVPYVADYLKQGTDAARNGTGAASIDGRTLGTNSFEVGPEVSTDLRNLAAGKLDPASPQAQWAVQVLAHELEHAVTPHDFNRQPLPALEWLEEGIATAIAGAPRGHARVAHAMGLSPRWSEDFLRDTHAEIIPGMLKLLDAAGIDVRTDRGFARAESILQGRPLAEVPAALAAAVATHSGIPKAKAVQLEHRIIETQGNEQNVDQLVAWIGIPAQPALEYEEARGVSRIAIALRAS